MNRDDIIRMAREAGWNGIYSKPLMKIAMQEEDFLRFAALVAAATLAEAAMQRLTDTQQDMERKPLTDDEIDRAWRSVDYKISYDNFRIEVARAIERAHGIGGEK